MLVELYCLNTSSNPSRNTSASPSQNLIADHDDFFENLQTEEEAEHDHTVALLAGSRFAYPSDEHPDWTTHMNVPERTAGINHGMGLVYPDIIVSNSRMEIVRVVQVVSKMTMNMDDVNLWKVCSSLSDAFFLFVRIETRAKVLQVLNFHRIPFRGLGLYAYDSHSRFLSKVD